MCAYAHMHVRIRAYVCVRTRIHVRMHVCAPQRTRARHSRVWQHESRLKLARVAMRENTLSGGYTFFESSHFKKCQIDQNLIGEILKKSQKNFFLEKFRHARVRVCVRTCTHTHRRTHMRTHVHIRSRPSSRMCVLARARSLCSLV